jgi:hypothetical protein
MTTKLQKSLLSIQKRRRQLEELNLRDTVLKKNSQLQLEWIEAKRVEQESKDIEAAIAIEEGVRWMVFVWRKKVK